MKQFFIYGASYTYRLYLLVTWFHLYLQDRFLPIANVARIMKKAIPNNGKISKEAKECAQECVSEFISFITSEYPLH